MEYWKEIKNQARKITSIQNFSIKSVKVKRNAYDVKLKPRTTSTIPNIITTTTT